MIQSIFVLIGRIALSAIFFFAAFQKITHWDATIQEMTSRGIVQASILLFFACIIEFFGALALVFGIKTRLAAFILALFLIPVTILFHNFWYYPSSEQYLQTLMFLKNVAIIGGLLLTCVSGPGVFSFDKS